MNVKREQELGIELECAKHFIWFITREELSPICKPDAIWMPTRKHPDYIFQNALGKIYILELTRWLTPELRRLEHLALKNIADPLKDNLQGECTLELPLDSFKDGKIPKRTSEVLVSEIQAITIASPIAQQNQLSFGCTLCKVSENGARLIPWITQKKLPYDLDVDSKAAKTLQKELEKSLREAEGKFRGYSGYRVLLINISQCGLDIDYHAHASVFKDGQGIILTWLNALSEQPSNIDYIYLEPGIHVRQNQKMVFTGHKHVGAHRGYYVEVWRRTGLPRLPR